MPVDYSRIDASGASSISEEEELTRPPWWMGNTADGVGLPLPVMAVTRGAGGVEYPGFFDDAASGRPGLRMPHR